ncbi:protein jag [uncultured Amnibacterium sp.]|uniref:Jag family protein n=1 Tax=uncultured Amnibacterium sp. TaxID=1631851 RepID=UPI0035C945C0
MSEPDSTGPKNTAPTSEEPGGDTALMEVGDHAADFIEGLLDICDLEGDIEIDQVQGRATVTVSADDPGALRLLSAGETVTALQDLTRLAVQTKTGEPARLILDIGGSRDQRSRELRQLVESAVLTLQSGQEQVSLPAMSSYERKLVHDLVAEHALASHSEGEGSARHTVITRA